MVIQDADRVVAKQMYQVAIGLVAAREHVSIAELAQEALDSPTPATIIALLSVGREKAWLPSVVDALAQVGIAAAEDVLSQSTAAAKVRELMWLAHDVANLQIDVLSDEIRSQMLTLHKDLVHALIVGEPLATRSEVEDT